MRTPLWETSLGALATLLNSRTDLVVLDLYTLTLSSGAVYRWSGTDVVVKVNGVTWSLGPIFKRGRTRLSVGVQVDSLDVTVMADASVQINAIPLLRFIALGGIDNARLQVDRAYMSGTDTAVVGTLLWFTGRIAQTKADRTQAALTVKSDLELLDVQVPRELYQAGCLNTLYDSACQVVRATYNVTGAATSASNATRTQFSHALGQAAGYFDLGVVTFTSGLNTGQSRTVKLHVAGTLTVLSAFPFAVANGDTFGIVPGCDKKQSTCSAKFANLVNFRGMPYVPVPETVM